MRRSFCISLHRRRETDSEIILVFFSCYKSFGKATLVSLLVLFRVEFHQGIVMFNSFSAMALALLAPGENKGGIILNTQIITRFVRGFDATYAIRKRSHFFVV